MNTLHNQPAVRFANLTTSKGAKVLSAVFAAADAVEALPPSSVGVIAELRAAVLEYGSALQCGDL